MKSIPFFLVVLLSLSVSGQNYTQLWTRTSINYKLNKKLNTIIEGHYRTQSLANTESPVRFPLASALRIWVVYQMNKDHSIHFSPYAYFNNYSVTNDESSINNIKSTEHRIRIQYAMIDRFSKKYHLIHRYGAEYRIFANQEHLLRWRIREALKYQVTSKISVQLYDELFLNSINVSRSHIFDQNRIGMNAEFEIHPKIHLDMGTSMIQHLSRHNIFSTNNYMFQLGIQVEIK